jgi:aminopeptidase N
MVDFIITAPSHYQVIATGLRNRIINLPGKRTTHYWSSSVPIPTKVMVFAAAEFAREYQEDIDGIPYSNWVYPQNMEEGFYDFQVTPDIMRFFTSTIGPYPFEKIANVQSTTRYGGMENAGNIFYHESSITGNRTNKLTIVHEIAHQWFGNSVPKPTGLICG